MTLQAWIEPSELDDDHQWTHGLPSKIDAALPWFDYKIMIFSGDKYYRFNRWTRSVSIFA